jgi:protein ImuB
MSESPTPGAQAHTIACLELPALPLQLALRAQPAWRTEPAVVLAADTPTALVLHANGAARAGGVTPGMRYGAARALCATLRAAVLDEPQIAEARDTLARALLRFTPGVEPAGRVVDGRFFLDPSGLDGLFGDVAHWAAAVHAHVTGEALRGVLVVGFHRFRTEALALDARRPGVLVLRSAEEERDRALRVPLARLTLPEPLRESLARLAVHTVGDLLRLPGDALRTRFGEVAQALHAAASAGAPLPVQPQHFGEPVSATHEVEPPDDDVARLLFAVRASLLALAARLVPRGEAIARLTLALSVERGEPVSLTLEPAQPTRDAALLVELVRLRLGALALPSRCTQLTLTVHGTRNPTEQLTLFPKPEPRDTRAAARALARVSAAFGPRSVTRARLRPAHLPETSFVWEPTREIATPDLRDPQAVAETVTDSTLQVPQKSGNLQNFTGTANRILESRHDTEFDFENAIHALPENPFLRVRAANDVPAAEVANEPPLETWPRLARLLLPQPVPIPDPPTLPGDPWPAHGEHGALVALRGPFRLSGGWWGSRTAAPVERDYYWAEMQRGDLLWVFYDRPRRRWFWHGYAD